MKKASRIVALALGWDGSRLPRAKLPPSARKFLGASARSVRPAAFIDWHEIAELRVCWVPTLTGSPKTLASPFPAVVRIPFRAVRRVPLGECLGVVYRLMRVPGKLRAKAGAVRGRRLPPASNRR